MLTCASCGGANADGARFCNGCGAKLGPAAAAREVRKTVTALFCDLVGSTTLGETHDPEVLRPLLERYFAAARGAIERHGGRVEKFIGDAVSAVFGLPVAHEDDALRAVRAAVEIQARLEVLAAGAPFGLSARVGVTTGEVLVPGDGTPLIGDTMNTAARLQTAAEPGQVLIGEPTYRLVRDAVVAEPVVPLTLKGKATPVAAYRVIQVASLSPMRTRRLDAPMVGRARESILLEGAYERAASDRACQLFTVLGTAGAGKSRLVEEFLSAHPDGDVLRGRCLPYGEGITWYPVTEALRGALDLPDFAGEAVVQAAIHAAVGEEEHATAIEANLARLFVAGEGGAPEETFWAIRRFLETRGRERPLIVVFDDIHWGEPTFLDFVEHVADWSRDAAILLLAMARPDLLDVRPTWGGGKTNATTISLALLTEPECGELINHLLGSAALPDAVRVRITAIAEGNPLFVEEMLRMLVDDGRLVRVGESWVAAGALWDVHVPPTISALLSARLDRLSDPERAVLEAAAVAGKTFHRGALAALLPETARPDLAVHLRSLVRKELVSPERSTLPGEDAYRFRHLLIRDAAYDAISKGERARLHASFADWLEAVAGARIVEQEEIVGYHLQRAYRYQTELGLPEHRELRLRAAKALGAAGVRALEREDAGAAVELLRPAGELAAGDPLELEILDRLVAALFDVRRFEDGRAVAERFVEAATAAGDAVYQARARTCLWIARTTLNPDEWDAEAAEALFREGLGTFREQQAQRFMAPNLSWLARVEESGGSAARALELATEAFDAAIGARDRRWIGASMNTVMAALIDGATPLSEALERANAFLRSFAGEPAITANALEQRADVNALLGRCDEARADKAATRAIVADIGNLSLLEATALSDAYVAWFEHGPAAAEGPLRECLDPFRESGDRLNGAVLAAQLSRVLLHLGRNRDAEELLVDFADHPHLSVRLQGLSIAAVIAARRGDLAEALRLAGEAEALAATTDFLGDQADVALDRAEILHLAGRPAEARAAAEDALARFERKEFAIGIRSARDFIATLPE
jgi:class 3 adenylate cyclase